MYIQATVSSYTQAMFASKPFTSKWRHDWQQGIGIVSNLSNGPFSDLFAQAKHWLPALYQLPKHGIWLVSRLSFISPTALEQGRQVWWWEVSMVGGMRLCWKYNGSTMEAWWKAWWTQKTNNSMMKISCIFKYEGHGGWPWYKQERMLVLPVY